MKPNSVVLQPGDKIIGVTDGITEHLGAGKQGAQAVQDIISQGAKDGLSAQEIANKLTSVVGTSAADDATAMAFEFKGKPGSALDELGAGYIKTSGADPLPHELGQGLNGLPSSSYPTVDASGRTLQLVDQYVGDAAYQRVDGQVVRILGKTEDGMVVESVENGQVKQRILSGAEENQLPSQAGKDPAARNQFLTEESKAGEFKTVADEYTMTVSKVGTYDMSTGPAMQSAIKPEIPGGTGESTVLSVQLQAADGSTHGIFVTIPNGFSSEAQANILMRTKEAIQNMPAESVSSLKAIEIPSFDLVTKTEEGTFRPGSLAFSPNGANADKIVITPSSFIQTAREGGVFNEAAVHSDQLSDILNHELGHVIAKDLAGGASSVPPEWAAVASHDFQNVSEYGATKLSEDFAESVRLYVASKGGALDPSLRDQFEHRFRYIDELLKNKGGG